MLFSCLLIQARALPAVCHEHFPMFLWQGEGDECGCLNSICTVGKEGTAWEKESDLIEAGRMCFIYYSRASIVLGTWCCPSTVACWMKKRKGGHISPTVGTKVNGWVIGMSAAWVWMINSSFSENYGLWWLRWFWWWSAGKKSRSHGNNHFSDIPIRNPFSSPHSDRSHAVERYPVCITIQLFLLLETTSGTKQWMLEDNMTCLGCLWEGSRLLHLFLLVMG